MPGIINSAPDCVTHVAEANADDMADFILQANYQDCAGFMTFGPGSTYGEEGAAAATSYYVLLGIGGVVMVAVFLIWIVAENRELVKFALGQEQPHRWRRADDPQRRQQPADRVPAAPDSRKRFEYAMIAISIALAIIVLVIVLFTNIGNEFRPSA